MRLQAIWEEVAPYQKLVIFMVLLFICALVFTVAGGILINLTYGIHLLTDPSAFSDFSMPETVRALKIMQLFSATGTFIIPALLAGFLFSRKPAGFLSLEKGPAGTSVMAVLALVILSTPVINQLMAWNQHMSLPGFMKGVEAWMMQSEQNASALTEAFLKMPDVGELMLNLLMIGVIPAIGEELLFRGVIQGLAKNIIKNSFFAILFTSILFSAMHLQFYGFLPRMAMGLLLGYLLEWSGTLWLPVIFHLINNSAAVLMAWFFPDVNLDHVGTLQGETWQLAVSVLFTAGLCYFLSRQSGKMQYKAAPFN